MVAVLIRAVVLVCFAVMAMRLMGKRQIGQLQPFELVIAIMIADLASTPMESLEIPLWRGVAPLLVTVALHQLLTLLSLKSQRLRAFFSGRPTVVIRNGRIDHAALEKLCFNLNDLLEELRTSGIRTPSEAGTAIMETSGKLSVFPKSADRPLTPRDLALSPDYEGVPLTLILDGKVERSNLALLGKSEAWLMKRVRELGFDSPRQVLLCYVDTDGRAIAHAYGNQPPRGAQALPKGEVNW